MSRGSIISYLCKVPITWYEIIWGLHAISCQFRDSNIFDQYVLSLVLALALSSCEDEVADYADRECKLISILNLKLSKYWNTSSESRGSELKDQTTATQISIYTGFQSRWLTVLSFDIGAADSLIWTLYNVICKLKTNRKEGTRLWGRSEILWTISL